MVKIVFTHGRATVDFYRMIFMRNGQGDLLNYNIVKLEVLTMSSIKT